MKGSECFRFSSLHLLESTQQSVRSPREASRLNHTRSSSTKNSTQSERMKRGKQGEARGHAPPMAIKPSTWRWISSSRLPSVALHLNLLSKSTIEEWMSGFARANRRCLLDRDRLPRETQAATRSGATLKVSEMQSICFKSFSSTGSAHGTPCTNCIRPNRLTTVATAAMRTAVGERGVHI